ncbi:alpha-amylase [Spirochaetia bacterium]|nr:alpha-amylase [Spirochaetia bacterium]GHU33980.1 alpha-amylase [Spirochaetia bacterium]
MPKWLDDAVFYEIYPQSFLDTNGDGIGDFQGIIEKLDYIKDLGCNALWINPCFDSPFKDAGYDVRDYKKTAERYGTNDDLKRLFAEAHRKQIHVLLDLVPGHTSEEHEWFIKSKNPEPNEYWNRYIWTNSWFSWDMEGLKFIAGETERNGSYIVNFFKCQPALNYGFLQPRTPWQLPVTHPDSIATREALKDIIRFWLDRGCDGFRVDMADSLVKFDDEKKTGTSAVWSNIREMLDKEYPEAAIVSEWSNPPLALKAGFHMDFLLDHEGKGYHTLMRDYKVGAAGTPVDDKSFFKKDAKGDICLFLENYLPWYESTKGDGYISLITGNHDTARLGATLSPDELAIAYATLWTLPGVPFLYYGDEIAMRYLFLPTKEGGFTRTGSRTPMQWTNGKNKGFSNAAPEKLYLPVDPAPGAPTVETQEKDSSSLLNTVKAILKLRHGEPDLQAQPNLEILYAEKGKVPFIYRRGSFVIAVNPSTDAVSAPVKGAGTPVFTIGTGTLDNGECRLNAQSFGIWKV